MEKNIRQAAEVLKNELAKTAEITEYLAVRDEYAENREIVTKVNEYNVQRSIYETEQNKPDPDTLLLESVEERMKKLFNEITENPIAVKLGDAEGKVNALYSEIFNIIQSLVTPENDGHSCGGSCGGCHGCG